ncbi:MAG: hypothetical protein HY831_04080 [Candidatus Aenigmarchaeota archaeon]|nr:hypothetical protein [Candidatus Aenigmarchaeota archaeon]
MKITFESTRTCPECEQFGLEVSGDENIFNCQICDSTWQRLRPINKNGKMINIPKKLRQLLKG